MFTHITDDVFTHMADDPREEVGLGRAFPFSENAGIGTYFSQGQFSSTMLEFKASVQVEIAGDRMYWL